MTQAGHQASWKTKQVVIQPVSTTKMVILHGRRTLQVSTDGSFDPALAWSLLHDGRSPEAAATALECDLGLVQDFIEQIGDAGLLVSKDRLDSAAEFAPGEKQIAIELIRDSAIMWKRHSLTHSLFSLLEDETRRPALALGLLVETCHYARLFPLISAKAARGLEDPAAAAKLSAFADEEMPHHKPMAGALAAHLNVNPEDIIDSRPSPSMQLLLSFLDSTADADPVAFASALSLVEMNDAPAEPSANAFLALADINGLPRELFTPFSDHAREDEALDHGQLAFEVLDATLTDEVAQDQLNFILNFIHDVKHGFDLIYDQLVDGWGDTDRPYKLRGSVQWQLL